MRFAASPAKFRRVRFLALIDAISGHGHAAVLCGILGGLRDAAPGAAVLIASGGLPIPAELVPAGVDVLQLPGLAPQDGLFGGLSPRAANLSRLALRKVRVAVLRALTKSFRPDVVLVEHYPFGRHAFHKELEAWLTDARACRPEARFVSSLSVLGGRAPEHRRAALVESVLRRNFDAVLVHTDERHERLDDDYPGLQHTLADKVRHTGYVLRRPPSSWAPRDAVRARLQVPDGARLVVAHAGAGRDGAGLLALALAGHAQLQAGERCPPVFLQVATGDGLTAAERVGLVALGSSQLRCRVSSSVTGLDEVVAAADAVISMSGYATCAELCAAGTPALLGPRRSDGEQLRRAQRMVRLGRAEMLDVEARPDEVASWLRRTLFGPTRATPSPVALSGAEDSAHRLLELARETGARAGREDGASHQPTAAPAARGERPMERT